VVALLENVLWFIVGTFFSIVSAINEVIGRFVYSLGRLFILDLKGCNKTILNDLDEMTMIMRRAAEAAGATVVSVDAHRFEPFGLSVTVIISESHIAIHTWPEFGEASADVFTCGDLMTEKAAKLIFIALGAKKKRQLMLLRGMSLHRRSHKLTQQEVESYVTEQPT